MCFEFENLPIEFDSQGNATLKEEALDPSSCSGTPLGRPRDDDPNRLRELLFERHITVVVHAATSPSKRDCPK